MLAVHDVVDIQSLVLAAGDGESTASTAMPLIVPLGLLMVLILDSSGPCTFATTSVLSSRTTGGGCQSGLDDGDGAAVVVQRGDRAVISEAS